MKVKQLIWRLRGCDPEALVVMSSDGEGNSYSPLADHWVGRYRAESTYHGEVGLETLTDEDKQAGYSDEDVMVDGERAVILHPTN